MHPEWALTPQRAAVHLPTATAVVADLHLGYNSARQRGGEAVPDPGADETLEYLRSLLDLHSVRRLLIAGDLFERAYNAALAEQWTTVLENAGVELLGLVPGNHDRGLPSCSPLPRRTVGKGRNMALPILPQGYRLGEWQVIHGDREFPAGPVVCGHFHPCVRWGRLASPCFLVTEGRLLLPAFSRDAAGVNVLGDPRWRDYHCLVPVGHEVLDFGTVNDLTRSRSGLRRGGRP
jgi:metallophosphoesterase superfamily enzyme